MHKRGENENGIPIAIGMAKLEDIVSEVLIGIRSDGLGKVVNN